jgi:hypothetical protein
MSDTHYVFSTLTADQVYTRTAMGGGDLPQTVAEVFVAGGSNISDKYLRTPIGVMTPVSDEELTILQENQVFKLHQENGFIKVEAKAAAPEKVAADMTTRDQSAPLVEGDFQDLPDDQKPKTNKDTVKGFGRKA